MALISTWADGYGRWHVVVDDTPRGLTVAVNAIADELAARQNFSVRVAREYVNQNIVSIPDSAHEYGGSIHFAEYRIDK